MTDRVDPDPDAERIREEAAGWIARVERQPSGRVQRDLERWLAADPRHAAAHARMSRRFGAARTLRASTRFAARPEPARRSVRAPIAVAALAVAAIILVLLMPARLATPPAAVRPSGQMVAANPAPVPSVRRATTATAIRSIGLDDGSVVTLDAGSAVAVAFTAEARRVTLERGRARFTVAHDGRPFTVVAGGGSVTARGTIFDVALDARKAVGVTLLRGVVDVTADDAAASAKGLRVRRLAAGEAVGYAAGRLLPKAAQPAVDDPRWADRAFEFDSVTLAYLVERANEHADTPVRIADEATGSRRVSGRFDLGDADRLAHNLATLFDLHAEARGDTILLSRE